MSRGEYKTFEEMIRKRWGMSMEGYHGIVRRGLLIRKMILRRESTTEDDFGREDTVELEVAELVGTDKPDAGGDETDE